MENSMDEYEQKAREFFYPLGDTPPKIPCQHDSRFNAIQCWDCGPKAITAALREAKASGETEHYDQLCTLIEQQQAEIAKLKKENSDLRENYYLANPHIADELTNLTVQRDAREAALLKAQEEKAELRAELEAAREELGNEICAYAELRQQADSVPKLQAELEAVLNDYKALGNQLGREIVELRQQAEQAQRGAIQAMREAEKAQREKDAEIARQTGVQVGCDSITGYAIANAILAQAEGKKNG